LGAPSLPHVSFSGTFLPPAPRRSDVLFEWPLTRSIISDTSFLCRDSLSTLSFIFRVSNSTTRILRCSTSYVHVEEQVSYLLPLQSDHLHRHQTLPTLRMKIFANYVQVSIVYSIVLKTKVPVKTWCWWSLSIANFFVKMVQNDGTRITRVTCSVYR